MRNRVFISVTLSAYLLHTAPSGFEPVSSAAIVCPGASRVVFPQSVARCMSPWAHSEQLIGSSPVFKLLGSPSEFGRFTIIRIVPGGVRFRRKCHLLSVPSFFSWILGIFVTYYGNGAAAIFRSWRPVWALRSRLDHSWACVATFRGNRPTIGFRCDLCVVLKPFRIPYTYLCTFAVLYVLHFLTWCRIWLSLSSNWIHGSTFGNALQYVQVMKFDGVLHYFSAVAINNYCTLFIPCDLIFLEGVSIEFWLSRAYIKN